jgi:hypothetical protein
LFRIKKQNFFIFQKSEDCLVSENLSCMKVENLSDGVIEWKTEEQPGQAGHEANQKQIKNGKMNIILTNCITVLVCTTYSCTSCGTRCHVYFLSLSCRQHFFLSINRRKKYLVDQARASFRSVLLRDVEIVNSDINYLSLYLNKYE